VKPVALRITFAGEAVELECGRFWADTHALPRQIEQVGGPVDGIDVDRAACRRHLELWADGSLVEAGEITFGDGGAITFRARGALGSSPDPTLRHGTAILEVTGGRGRLAGVRGFVTSNFLLSDAGELTDHHLGVLFVEQPHGGGSTP